MISQELASYSGCRRRESNFADDFMDKSTSVMMMELGAEAKNQMTRERGDIGRLSIKTTSHHISLGFTLLSVRF